MVKWLREVVRAHYYFDPLGAILFDLNIVALAVFCVVAGLYLA